MRNTHLSEGAKSIMDDTNLLPLLSELNPSEKIVIPTIGNSVVRPKSKKSTMKLKSLQGLARVNLCEC